MMKLVNHVSCMDQVKLIQFSNKSIVAPSKSAVTPCYSSKPGNVRITYDDDIEPDGFLRSQFNGTYSIIPVHHSFNFIFFLITTNLSYFSVQN